ncbi:Uncharacterized protein DBV15_06692 [Temnothorax longispinosus]|uniref:Uncharacterized protein n=1 Tax=Temnothorax longispinosus TaxID=300112 RepID=A0A4S2KYV1_9HYME|nr:Uncharacterized protein DBV15_06692 [Temnothorax longispinosus]
MIQRRGGGGGKREHISVGNGVGEATVWGGSVAGLPGGWSTRRCGQRDFSVASLQNPKNVPKLERYIVSGIVDVKWVTIFFRTRNQILLSLPPSTTPDRKAFGISR